MDDAWTQAELDAARIEDKKIADAWVSPDLEPVRRLIEWIAKLPETDDWDGKRINVQYLCFPSFFRKALPALHSLLEENERLREELIARAQMVPERSELLKAVDSATKKIKSLREENAKLAEENTHVKAVNELVSNVVYDMVHSLTCAPEEEKIALALEKARTLPAGYDQATMLEMEAEELTERVAQLQNENAKLTAELTSIREDIADEAAFRESRKIDAAREAQRRREAGGE